MHSHEYKLDKEGFLDAFRTFMKYVTKTFRNNDQGNGWTELNCILALLMASLSVVIKAGRTDDRPEVNEEAPAIILPVA